MNRPDHFGTYAPDPDADFEAGRRVGYREGINAPSPIRWTHKRVTAGEQKVKLALICLAILGVAFAIARAGMS